MIDYKIGANSEAFDRALQRSIGQLEQLGAKAQTVGQKIDQNLSESAKRADGAWGALGGKLQGLLGGFAALASVKFLANQSDQALLLNARLEAVLGTMQKKVEAQAILFSMAQRLQVPFAEVAATFTKLLPAVQELKGGAKEAAAITEVLMTTARIGGATAQQAASAAQQMTQALGSGVLQGDELKSVLENNQVLARTLATALGVPIGKLKELGAQGKLTSEVVGNALLKSFDEIKTKGEALPSTVGGAFTKLANATSVYFAALSNGGNVFTFVARAIGEIVKVVELMIAKLGLAGVAKQELGSSAVKMAQIIGKAFAYVGDVVGSIIRAFQTAGGVIGLVAAMVRETFSGNFKVVEVMGQEAAKDISRSFNELFAGISGRGPLVQGYSAVLLGESTAGGRERGARTSFGKLSGTPSTKDAKPAQSRMSGWDTELEEMKVRFQEQARLAGQFRQFEVSAEINFWKTKLGVTKSGTAENLAVRKKLAELQQSEAKQNFEAQIAQLRAEAEEVGRNASRRLEYVKQEAELIKQAYGENSKEFQQAERRRVQAVREAAEQIEKIRTIEADSARAAQLSYLAYEEQQARLQVDLGLATKEEMLVQQQEFERRKLEIAQQALEAKLLAVDPSTDPVAYAQILQQIEALQLQHNQVMIGLSNDLARERSKDALGAIQSIQQSWSNTFAQLLQQQISFGQAAKQIFGAIGQAVVQMFAKMAAQWVMQQILMRVFGIATGKAQIAAESAKAGAGGVASMAAAPFPLNLTAPAFGAAMAAAAAGFAGFSAAGGFDIPAHLNPVTQLHAREMVLPAKYADAIRDMTETPSSSGSGGGAITINAVDSESVQRLFENNGVALVEAMRMAQRRGY